jgi:hypothetical protein
MSGFGDWFVSYLFDHVDTAYRNPVVGWTLREEENLKMPAHRSASHRPNDTCQCQYPAESWQKRPPVRSLPTPIPTAPQPRPFSWANTHNTENIYGVRRVAFADGIDTRHQHVWHQQCDASASGNALTGAAKRYASLSLYCTNVLGSKATSREQCTWTRDFHRGSHKPWPIDLHSKLLRTNQSHIFMYSSRGSWFANVTMIQKSSQISLDPVETPHHVPTSKARQP